MITILCHLYYHHLWDELNSYFCKIKNCNLYVNLVNDKNISELNEIKNKILRNHPSAKIIVSPNQGKDCGGNLRLINEWLQDGAPGDFIIQCHTKSNDAWRRTLLNPLFDNPEYIEYLFKDVRTGMVGNVDWLLHHHNDVNMTIYNECKKQFGMDVSQPMVFIAGTMFCIRSCIYKDFFSKFNPLEIADGLEFGNTGEPSRTHSWERIFSSIVIHMGYRIKPCDYAKQLLDLFDEQFYMEAYVDVRNKLADRYDYYPPFAHFLKHGRNECRRMNRMIFDEDYYLRENPDVAHAVNSGSPKSGYQHFLLHGHKENRKFAWHPDTSTLLEGVFEESHYLEENPDVLNSMIASGWPASGYEHYVLHGKAEGRQAKWRKDEELKTNNGKSICLFSHYSTQRNTPKRVEVYLKELSRHFDEIEVISNQDVGLPYNVTVVKNEGLDFGMWKKKLNTIPNIAEYNRIGLINDSVTLFDTLDHIFEWADKEQFDFWGLNDSYDETARVEWRRSFESFYHIQSYFMIFERKAIKHLINFFKDYVIYKILIGKQLRIATVMEGEIRLTNTLIKKGMKAGTYVKTKDIVSHNLANINPHINCWKQLIEAGLPVIKNKIINGDFSRLMLGVNFDNWHLLIQSRMKNWNYDEVFD